MKSGMELIQEERFRQIHDEGYSVERDKKLYTKEELANAGLCYWIGLSADAPEVPGLWPWRTELYKPKDRISNLVRAGALFLAQHSVDENPTWMWSVGKIAKKIDLVQKYAMLGAQESKTLHNTTASQAKDNVKDIVFWGDGDTFKLISKASSKTEGWMKSTKAMAIEGIGCVVQVTTQQGSNVAEAVTFVPGAKIQEVKNDAGEVIKRRVVSANQPDVVTISNPVTAE